MTKKLEEEFNLPPIEEVTKTEPTIVETEAEIEETQNALSVSEKINLAFKEIKGLEDHEDEMNEIAKKAIERKTGARGLRSILESILMETMYKVPSEESLNKVVLDGSVVKGETEPLMVYEKTTKTKTG